jgi:hypothetical protein
MTRHRRLAAAAVFLNLIVLAAAPPSHAAFESVFGPDGAGPLYPDRADGRITRDPSLVACALGPGETIVVDGRLDDAVWARAEAGFGLVQHEPERGGTASVPTVFKIAYDRDAVYVAAACYEDDMARVARRLSRRDNIASSDFVSIYFDPYHDRLTGYNFRVTADGVKADHYLFDDTGRDADWNAVWQAETWEDDRGWYVEVRIPLQTMRFKPAASMTWGLQFYRWLHGRGEDTGWATWDRNQSGFVSRWGTLTGLDGLDNPRRLEVLPYVAGGLADESVPDDDDESFGRYLNLGVDLKYNLTSALTAQATFQPDFGQVEADPATLNLSPFETFYQEKRPFFVEGARFFEHPMFNLFYSRRIGTGDVDSRIRAAAKLTGKIDGQTSVSVLGALTDVAPEGRVHNPFVGGVDRTGYGVVRVARDLDGGRHRVGLMATGVDRRDDGGRDAWSGGADWSLTFDDRAWAINGSAVGTIVDPHPVVDDPTIAHDPVYGTAGELALGRQAGTVRGYLSGRWESDRFDPNDLGYLQANDEIATYGWLQYRYDDEGRGGALKSSYPKLGFWKSWLYGDQRRLDTAGDEVWAYGKGHRQSGGVSAEWWGQTHGYWSLYGSLERGFEGTSKYDTRTYGAQRGPLMTVPAYTSASASVETDFRRDTAAGLGVGGSWSDVGSRHAWVSVNLRRDLAGRASLSLSATFTDRDEDAQWLDNLADPSAGIDGVAYVFGRLQQRTIDVKLRGSLLFSRDLSLECYLQPYLTTGDYSDPRHLATPDSRDLRPYAVDATQYDFNYEDLNLNVVWRWEYRPGSTMYLVWTHGRVSYEEQRLNGSAPIGDGLDFGGLLSREPRNTVLAKVNWWFSI